MRDQPPDSASWTPTRQQLAAAISRRVPDVIASDLAVLFCGINPGLYSAAIGHHFGRPGNRFWPALWKAGFTDRLFSPFEDAKLLSLGLGITNLVDRATASAAELTATELRAGGRRLQRKVKRWRPRFVAFVGIIAYRAAYERPRAPLGLQAEKLGAAHIWVLPNPSGLNAHFQVAELAELFADLGRAAFAANQRGAR